MRRSENIRKVITGFIKLGIVMCNAKWFATAFSKKLECAAFRVDHLLFPHNITTFSHKVR